ETNSSRGVSVRDTFFEFYRPSPEEVGKFITHATIAVDANVLLGLYRLPTAARTEVLDVLEGVKDRLWLPFQAGLEYQRNRLDVISAQAGAYESAKRIHGARDLDQMATKLLGLNIAEEVRGDMEQMLPGLDSALRAAIEQYERAVEELAVAHVVTVE